MRATYLAESIGCRTQKPAADFVSEGVTGSARALLARTRASVSIIRTYAHHGRRIILGLGQGSVILLWAVSASAQTAGTSTSQICTQDPTYCSDTGAVAEHDDGQWNEQFGVERRFGWRRFGRRSGRAAVDSQRPMRRRFPHQCLGWLQLNGSATLARQRPTASRGRFLVAAGPPPFSSLWIEHAAFHLGARYDRASLKALLGALDASRNAGGSAVDVLTAFRVVSKALDARRGLALR
jgi:hypothetical protein